MSLLVSLQGCLGNSKDIILGHLHLNNITGAVNIRTKYLKIRTRTTDIIPMERKGITLNGDIVEEIVRQVVQNGLGGELGKVLIILMNMISRIIIKNLYTVYNDYEFATRKLFGTTK